MWSICKKELNQFFSNLTGYIAIILFLLINGIFLFMLPDSSILEYGYATLDKFFELAPWVLLFLVPAITMRSLSDEFKAGTFEILKTKPLSSRQIVLGKYIAVLLVLLFVIVPTFIYIITIKSLSTSGSIDSGGIAGSYAGLFLLAAVFAAISLCCSSFTGNAVVYLTIAYGEAFDPVDRNPGSGGDQFFSAVAPWQRQEVRCGGGSGCVGDRGAL